MPTGYSGTPQWRKLGLKPGLRMTVDGAPRGWALEDPPDGITLGRKAGPADVIVAFFRAADDLPIRLPGLADRIHPEGSLWVAWPRRAGGHVSDITDNVIRQHALPLGVVDVKVAAIDEDWSGVKLVWRLENR